MKKGRTIILLFTLISTILSNSVFGQQVSHIIFFYKPYTDSVENNLYVKTIVKFNYKTQYNNVKSADINSNLKRAIQHNDYRFIALSGNSYVLPGLEGYAIDKNGNKSFGYLKKYEKYINKYRFKTICGTSDAMDSSMPDLQSVAADYAKKYNKALLVRVKELENKR